MGKTPEQSYEFLKERFGYIDKLRVSEEILMSDGETMMAKGSQKSRVELISALTDLSHITLTDPHMYEALENAKGADLSFEDKRNLELMHHKWMHEASLSTELARELGIIKAEGDQLHTEHYKSGDWKIMGPWYKRSFKASREAGQAKQEKMGFTSPHEALIDQFSPGSRIANINENFSLLGKVLPGMIQEAIEKQKHEEAPLPMEGPFDLEVQKIFGREIAERIGFDFNRGVHHAIKGHPSMCGGSDDIRITTRLSEKNLVPGIYGSVHETGHAVYEQNLPVEWRYQPVGRNLGMAVHETQSMIMEYQAAMTPEFLGFLAERLQQLFNKVGNSAYTPENIRLLQTRVKPSFIRTDADEMTYPIHVLLRHDLESKMLSNELDVLDLPDAWNEAMQEGLGITPANAADGCMQDIHWPAGLIGYFQSYTFGGMGAAQLFQAAVKAYPEIREELARGSTEILRSQWLGPHIHNKGSFLTVEELFRQATGGPPSAVPYLNHLSERYLDRAYEPA